MSNNVNTPLKVAAYLKGVGIVKVELDDQNNLIFTMSDGTTHNVGALIVDDHLGGESTNPVQNKTIYATLQEILSVIDQKESESEQRDETNKEYLAGLINDVNNALTEHKRLFERFQEYADPQLERVEDGSVVIDNTDSEITSGGKKPVAGGAIFTALQGKVDKVEGKGLSTNDYSNEDKAQVAKIAENIAKNTEQIDEHGATLTEHAEAIAQNAEEIGRKQPQLSITLKDNGNIVIGNLDGGAKEFMPATPSGDPMHYAYVAAGATWNASTGYWEYGKNVGGLDDLTNEDMRVCYAEAWLNSAVQSGVFFNVKGRTTLNRMVWSSAIDLTNAYRGDNLEVIFLKGSGSDAIPKNITGSFWFCYKLKRIANIIDLNYGSVAFEIRSCPLLEYIRLKNIKKNVDISQCPKISKDSLLYMIQNSAATSDITIKVHADVYAKYSADSDIVAALAAKPLVTLISA